MEKTNRFSWKATLSALVVTLGLCAVAAVNMGIGEKTTAREVLWVLSDACFVVGALVGGLGALMVISTTGFFDIMGYGMKSIWYLFTPMHTLKDMPDFYAYKVEKAESRGRTRWELAIAGGVALLIALIANILLYRV